jgi:hypothetical protein
MGRDRHMHDAASLVCQDDQHEEESIRNRWHDEEIGRHDLADLIREKRTPRLGGRPSVPGQVFRDSRLTEVHAKLEEFAVNARSTPQRVGLRHRANQLADVPRNARSTQSPPAFPPPE